MERRHRTRSAVRFVVDEHKYIKAMGVLDTIGLFRIASACSKADVIKARQRATFAQDPILDVICCPGKTSTALHTQTEKMHHALSKTQNQDAETTKLPSPVNLSLMAWKYDAILRSMPNK